MSRPAATIPTNVANSGQRVSNTSSLRMFCTVLKPISGRNRPKAISPASAASRSARMISTRDAGGDASTVISHFLHVRPAENALRQEDHGDREDRERRDVLVVGGE